MYFSKITLQKNIEVEKLAKILRRNDYYFHQHVWQLFKSAGGSRDFLYRQEKQDWPCFYILSQREPQDNERIWEVQIKDFAPKLQVGQRLAFALRANPVRTKRQEVDGKLHKMRCDVVMNARNNYEKEQRPPLGDLMQQAGWEWLQARMQQNGFEVNSSQLRIDSYQQHRLFKKNAKEPIRFSTLDFDGILTVIQVEAFLKMLYSGIGSARSFGCGMMLVRKI